MMSGDVEKIQVTSEFNLFAMGYNVQDAIGSFIKTSSYRIIMFRDGKELSLLDEIDTGTLLDIFVKDAFVGQIPFDETSF